MNGLQSLMQGAPRQPQPQQAPAMPNDPRMGAAMSVVDDSVEKFNLDPQTEALMLQNQALGLLQAADNVGKMNAPQQDASIQEQTTQGIAGMLQSLAPGMQQRGRQVQSGQARKMLGGGAPARPAPARPPMGGMPSMGAPNMQRMADGGIVGYAEGGDVQQQDPMQAQLERFMQLQKLYEARQAAGATEEELTRIQEDIDSYSRVNSPGYNIEVEAAKARGEYDTPNGMADGGSVLFDEMGVSSDSPQFNVMSETLTNYPTMGPPEKEEPDEKSPKREANFLDKIQSFIAENVIDPDLSRRQFDMRGSGSAMRGRLSDRQKLLAGLLNNKVERGEMTREEALDAILGPKESGMARGGIIGYQDGGSVGEGGLLFNEMGKDVTNMDMTQMFNGLYAEDPTGPRDPSGEKIATEIRMLEKRIREINNSKAKQFEGMSDSGPLGNAADLVAGIAAMMTESAPSEVTDRLASLKKARDRVKKAKGMARGGIIGYQDGGGVELDEELIAAMLAQNAQTTAPVYPSAEERRAGLADEAAKRAQARDARRQEQLTRQELANRGLTGTQINELLSRSLDAVEPGGIGELKKPQFDTRNPQTGPFLKPLIDDASIGTATGLAGDPTTAEGLLEALAQQTDAATNVATADSPISELLMERLNAAPDNAGALEQATRLRESETGLANSAYAMSPEMKAAYAAAKAKEDEYYEAQLDPKRLRSKKLDELITGFATPGGIRTSGIAALKGTTGVDDAALEMKRQRGVEDFARTKEQAGIEREGRVKAYEGGRSTFNTAFDRLSGQATQALQTLGAMANSEQTKAQTERLANNKNQLDLTKAKLDSIFQQGRLDEQSRATAVRLLDSQSRRLIDFRKQLSDVLDTLGTPEEKAALLKENAGYIQSQVEVVNAARAELGLPAMPLVQTSTGGGGETESTGDPELDKLLQQY